MDSVLLQNMIIAIVGYGAGILTGYFLRGAVDVKIKDQSPNSLVLIAVTTVWVVSMFVDIISPDYETPTLVHGLMGAIVGFFYKPLTGNNKEKTDK